MFSLQDVEYLDRAISQIGGVKLIVIDPVGTFLGANRDAHRDNEVRAVLQPVATLAEKHGAAVLIVAHRRKMQASHADDVVLGSRAFTGLARCVWHVSRDGDDPARRLFTAGKSNLAPEGTGLAFRIEGEPPAVLFEADPVYLSADEALYAESQSDRHKPGPEAGAREDAAEWLEGTLLAVSPRKKSEIEAMARDEGFKMRTLDRAASDLGVVKVREGFPAVMWWSLPQPRQDGGQPRHGAQSRQDSPHSLAKHPLEQLNLANQASDIENADYEDSILANQCAQSTASPSYFSLGVSGETAPEVPPGWTPGRWAADLRRRADVCQRLHPDKATELRQQAAEIEAVA